MRAHDDFDLQDFLPYLLNQAAEASSLAFQRTYRKAYGMLRTEWRVLFHLGCYGDMTAKEICSRASIHKTKVSRAVSALEAKRYLARHVVPEDRRNERLSLTPQGLRVFSDLSQAAKHYDKRLAAGFTADEIMVLKACLARLASAKVEGLDG